VSALKVAASALGFGGGNTEHEILTFDNDLDPEW
jgi:hypothetical protein